MNIERALSLAEQAGAEQTGFEPEVTVEFSEAALMDFVELIESDLRSGS